MLITVFGSGYVGLVTAAGFADAGHIVACIDIDAARVDSLRAGSVPFFEPGLKDIVSRSIRGGRLTFGTRLDEKHRGSDVFFVAVGTPPLSSGAADVSAVLAAAETIARTATKSTVVAVKSTVPVGTADKVQTTVDPICAHPIFVASVPEFLKEGTALEDFFRPDRVVLGVAHSEAERRLRDVYRPFQLSSERILVTDRRSSELSKYAANAILAARISFMNELSRLCDSVGADIHSIRYAIGSDRRVGPHFLYAGPGYGGSCFPKDVSALARFARDAGVELEVVEAAARANARQPSYVLDRISTCFPEGMRGKVIAIWGLAYKAGTDDVRESPAAPIVRSLLERGAAVRAHDPEAAANFARVFAPEASYFDSEYDAVAGADLLLLMTEWRHLRNPDFERVRRSMRTPAIVDARNIWSTFDLNSHGFHYLGIGTRAGRPVR